MMKKDFWFSLLLLAALMLAVTLAACASRPESPAESDTPRVTDSATEAPSESVETPTESDTEADTAPAETELFENGGLIPSEPVTGSAALSKPYAEKITASDGSVALKNAGVTMNFNSRFYGHDSAIDRDLSQYGWVFLLAVMDKDYYQGDFFLGEVTGDHYQDMILYADGILTIYPAVVKTQNTFEYNGKTYDSVYGNDRSEYTFGEPITYPLNLPDATLRGTGDFDRNGYCDLLLVRADGTVVLGLVAENGITPTTAGVYHGEISKLYSGDVNADGRWDLVMIDGHTVTTLLQTDEGFASIEPTTLPFSNPYSAIAVGDINNDRYADVVWFEEDEGVPRFRSMFGRGDGFFGPRPEELGEGKGNTNLYAVTERSRATRITWFAVGDMSGDGVGDVLFHAEGGRGQGISLGINSFDPPYDYSLFGFVTEEGTYKMFAGGRWYDQSEALKDSLAGDGYGDGDHVMMYFSEDGITWDRYLEGPAFYLGIEQGYDGWEELGEGWWTGNTLEPEVVYVDGVYHMILQSSGVTQSGWYGDYLNYASSTDGIHFTRKTDSPIILPEPGKDFTQFKEIYGYEIGFNHHELIYVPDDPDGKCFHLYAGHFVNNNWAGYVRIRSADPTCFYWSEREGTEGFSQIGNQIGYISDYDGKGGRLFLRITFHVLEDEDGSRTVPTLQYSTNGLNFSGTGIDLASVDVTDPVTENNHNVYFLGFCTVNGTGEIERNPDGGYKLVYLATTANDPGGFPIFWAEAGVGVLNFTLE